MNHDTFRKQARQDYNQQPVNPEHELTDYNTLDYNSEDHGADLLNSADEGKLVCVCDEETGGIIAYAIGEDNAVLIAQALLFYRKALEKKNKPRPGLKINGEKVR